MIRCFLLLLLLHPGINLQENNYYYTNHGKAEFRSEAQQELIKASTTHLRGVLDPVKRTYAFKVIIRTFQGFNSSLQQEHFNEKYLESDKFPEATFSGKIIEDIDLTIDGTYDVRTKGKLVIHGIEKERIIRSKVIVKNGTIYIETQFSILLSDHNIKVPKVVHEKIASEIVVHISADFPRKQ
jgi:polyisoprenoid-binding protein YceI